MEDHVDQGHGQQQEQHHLEQESIDQINNNNDSGSSPAILTSLISLRQSISFIEALPFQQSNALSSTAIFSERRFEQVSLSDATYSEIALFGSNPSLDAPAAAVASNAASGMSGDRTIVATKRRAPKRIPLVDRLSSPIKKQQPHCSSNAGPPADLEVEKCLVTAQKLLNVWPMQRNSQHIEALLDQLSGLMDSINKMESALSQPLPLVTRSAPKGKSPVKSDRSSELVDSIKSDEMEIFALTEMSNERQKDIAHFKSLLRQSKTAAAKPTSQVKRAVPTFTKQGNTLEEQRQRDDDDAMLAFGKSALTLAERKAAAAVLAGESSSTAATPTKSPRKSTLTSPQSHLTTPRRVSATISTPSPSRLASRRGEALDPPHLSSIAADSATSPALSRTSADPRAAFTLPSPVKAVISLRGITPKKLIVSKVTRPVGIEETDLEDMASKIWNGTSMREFLNPWARKMLVESGKPQTEIPRRLKRMSFEDTFKTLSLVLSAQPSSETTNPTPSISSSAYPSVYPNSEDDNDETGSHTFGGPPIETTLPTPASSLLVEVQLLYLFLYSSSTRSPLPFSSASASTSLGMNALAALTPTIREVISPITFQPLKNLEALLALPALKLHLSAFAIRRGWETENGSAGGMATTAIYSLVSKKILRIDRRGGAMVGWVINE